VPPFLSEIAEADWEKTPESVKQLIGRLGERIAALEEQVQRNSKNSSQPPSQDTPQGFKAPPKPRSKRARGGQVGHAGHEQQFIVQKTVLPSKSIIPAIVVSAERN